MWNPVIYKDFYGFEQRPFSLSPDPDFFFPSQQHTAVSEALQASLKQKQPISVLTGEVGTGKTTIKAGLLEAIEDTFTVAHITSANDAYGDNPEWILNAFLQTRPNDKPNTPNSCIARDNFYHALIDYVRQKNNSGKAVVLIIDEAQGLTTAGLQTLHKCTQILLDQGLEFHILLFGQKELHDTLDSPELATFKKMIHFIDHLQSLNMEETNAYINHRILLAGAQPNLFTASAIKSVFQQSGGTPRIINVLCETALIYGYREASPVINSAITTLVGTDRQAAGLITGKWHAPERVIMQTPDSGNVQPVPQPGPSKAQETNDYPNTQASIREQHRYTGLMDVVSVALIITLGTLLWLGRDQLLDAHEKPRIANVQENIAEIVEFAALESHKNLPDTQQGH